VLDTVAPFSRANSGTEALYVDPSRGALLSLVVQAPSFQERFEQGGLVGYIIIFGVLAIGLLIVLERTVTLTLVGGKVSSQLKNMNTPNDDNPLGRIMKVYYANKNADKENLELKLDEAIMKEVPAIERGIAIVKVCAALGPLLGLLGTVTGMIETFQVITMFGGGDPKLMAGGISSALVTTVQGLVCAIPLIFLHTYVSGKSKGLIHVLEEQSTGLLAQHLEK
jgi:biopolymer transport protein ExbB